MKILKASLAVMIFLFLMAAAIYWFNLDTRLVKALEKPLMRYYDNLPRDHRL